MTKKKPVVKTPAKPGAELPLKGVNNPATQKTIDGKGEVFKSPSADVAKQAEVVLVEVMAYNAAKDKLNAAKRKLLQLMEFEHCKHITAPAGGVTVAIDIREGEDRLKFTTI